MSFTTDSDIMPGGMFGFDSSRPDPEQDYFNRGLPAEAETLPNESAVPSPIAQNMGVDARGDFRADAAPMQIAAGENYGRNSSVNHGRVSSGGRSATSVDDLLQSFGAQPNQPEVAIGEPHPMLEDDKFWQAARSDPKRAGALYKSLTQRDLQADMQRYQAQEKTKQDFMKQSVGKLIQQGLEFDDVTGDITTTQWVRNPDSNYDPNQPDYKADKRILSNVEKALVTGMNGKKGGYELLTGMKPPEPVALPTKLKANLSPIEEAELRQRTKDIAKDGTNQIGGSKLSWQDKVSAAMKQALTELHQNQETTTAASGNVAANRANPDGLILGAFSPKLAASRQAKVANLLTGVVNQATHTGRQLLEPFGINTPETDIPMISGDQIGGLLPSMPSVGSLLPSRGAGHPVLKSLGFDKYNPQRPEYYQD